MTNEQTLASMNAKISSLRNSITYIDAIMETPSSDDAKICLISEVLKSMKTIIDEANFYALINKEEKNNE